MISGSWFDDGWPCHYRLKVCGEEKKKRNNEEVVKEARRSTWAAAMYKHLIWGQQVAMITLLCLLLLPHPRENNGSRSFDRSLGSCFLCCSSSLSMSCTTQPSTPEGKTHTEGEKSLMSDQIKLQQHKQYIMPPKSLNPIILPYLSLVLDFSSSIPRNAGSINKSKCNLCLEYQHYIWNEDYRSRRIGWSTWCCPITSQQLKLGSRILYDTNSGAWINWRF